MSLYNMLNGNHPMTGELLGILGFTQETFKQIPRYRDVFVYEDNIKILTRTGGGNRSEYEMENQWLTEQPGYITNYDDPFDSTFAWWVFEIPAEHKLAVDNLIPVIREKAPHLLPESLKEITERNIAALDDSKR